MPMPMHGTAMKPTIQAAMVECPRRRERLATADAKTRSKTPTQHSKRVNGILAWRADFANLAHSLSNLVVARHHEGKADNANGENRGGCRTEPETFRDAHQAFHSWACEVRSG